MSKEAADADGLFQFFVSEVLCSAVSGERLAQRGRQRPEPFMGDTVCFCHGSIMGFDNEDDAGDTLIRSAQTHGARRGVHQRIIFPVAEGLAFLNMFWSFIN